MVDVVGQLSDSLGPTTVIPYESFLEGTKAQKRPHIVHLARG